MKSSRRAMWFLSAALILGGCATDPVGPTNETDLPSSSLGAITSESSGWIGLAGGVLSVCGRTLTIPAGALHEPTYISLRRLSDGSVDLEPDGQTFLVPVQILFVVPASAKASAYQVEWYDPSAEEWTQIPSLSAGGSRTASLAHFSRYQLVLCD